MSLCIENRLSHRYRLFLTFGLDENISCSWHRSLRGRLGVRFRALRGPNNIEERILLNSREMPHIMGRLDVAMTISWIEPQSKSKDSPLFPFQRASTIHIFGIGGNIPTIPVVLAIACTCSTGTVNAFRGKDSLVKPSSL